MGKGAYGGTLCGPVFKEFMTEAMQDRQPGQFREPRPGALVMARIDRKTGERLPDDASGADIITELFRAGTAPDVYETVAAITGDDWLFDGISSRTISDINAASDLPTGSESVIREADPAGGGVIREPRRQEGGGIGVGTGGLY